MSHHHHHHNGHAHHNNHTDKKQNILFAACLNLGFTVVELIGGLLTNSAAVLADALHDLGDSLALFGAYVAERQATKAADSRRTFGYARLSLLSALVSAVILLCGSLFILYEGITRLYNPEPVAASWVALLALFGIGVNFLAYKRLSHGHSANEAVLSWHLLEDVLGWVAVLVGAGIMYLTGWYIIDALLTIGFTLFIMWGVFRNLKEVVNLILEGVPTRVDITALKAAITNLPLVESIHDVHVWSLDGEHLLVTGHVVLLKENFQQRQEILSAIKAALEPYSVAHTTIAFETAEDECFDRCD